MLAILVTPSTHTPDAFDLTAAGAVRRKGPLCVGFTPLRGSAPPSLSKVYIRGSTIGEQNRVQLASFELGLFCSSCHPVLPFASEFRLFFANDNMALAKEQQPSIVYGPRAPIPLTLTFGQLLDHHAGVRPDAPAVISHVQNCTVTYRQLADRSIELAKAMAGVGIGKGDMVGIIMGTRFEYLEVGNCRAL